MSTETGRLIKKRREELGLTQEELAKKLGYKSKSTINKIEVGINDINQTKIVKFANALGVPISFIMEWDDDDDTRLKSRINDMELLLQDEPQYMLSCLSSLIKKTRINQGISEKALALKVNISLDDYLLFESQYKGIGTHDIINIMSQLHLNFYYILGYLTSLKAYSEQVGGISDDVNSKILNYMKLEREDTCD